ncbi:CU044_5270 family protein [Actinomadura macrotermitis]|uniref:CU044_5270 family protein n=1 Tax=Actinomadura macrotermitis TaxID=2585200 RepID=A0A7K0C649_9ACTN|nr:CU044_5270 family protein [Actinomadura macrotermitis]MQY08913.1 hypothetical protein [Actinomadura macrotermitis]
MNDLHEVRRIMAPADPCPPGTFDGAAHDPAGRAAYARITAATDRRTAPSRRMTFRLVAAGGVAGALVAGAVVATGGGGPSHPAPAQASETQQVLNVAATFALKKPFTAPRPGQWVYTETRFRRSGVPGRGQVIKPGSPLKTQVDRTWVRADGKVMALYDQGKLVTSATGGAAAMPPTDYATISKLPTDPDGMLAWFSKQKTPNQGNEGAFQMLGSLLLNNGALPPAQTAAAYRAMAKIPGVTVDRTAKDATGHKAISVSFLIEGWAKDEILLDPSTYAYRGHRTTVAQDHTLPDGGRFLKGAVESYSVLVAAGVVDRPGLRP